MGQHDRCASMSDGCTRDGGGWSGRVGVVVGEGLTQLTGRSVRDGLDGLTQLTHALCSVGVSYAKSGGLGGSMPPDFARQAARIGHRKVRPKVGQDYAYNQHLIIV